MDPGSTPTDSEIAVPQINVPDIPNDKSSTPSVETFHSIPSLTDTPSPVPLMSKSPSGVSWMVEPVSEPSPPAMLWRVMYPVPLKELESVSDPVPESVAEPVSESVSLARESEFESPGESESLMGTESGGAVSDYVSVASFPISTGSNPIRPHAPAIRTTGTINGNLFISVFFPCKQNGLE